MGKAGKKRAMAFFDKGVECFGSSVRLFLVVDLLMKRWLLSSNVFLNENVCVFYATIPGGGSLDVNVECFFAQVFLVVDLEIKRWFLTSNIFLNDNFVCLLANYS